MWVVVLLCLALLVTSSAPNNSREVIHKLTGCTTDKAYRYHLPNGQTPYVLPPSHMMQYFLKGLCGIEIGPAAFAPTAVATVHVGIDEGLSSDLYQLFKQADLFLCGDYAKIDIAAYGHDLHMFADNAVDFVVNSHVWEHFPNPLKVLEEWVRVTSRAGFLYLVVPHRNALPEDVDRPLTTIQQLKDLYDVDATEAHPVYTKMNLTGRNHFTIFSVDLILQIMTWFNDKHCHGCLEGDGSILVGKQMYLSLLALTFQDDTAGNGHVVVWQVHKASTDAPFSTIVDYDLPITNL